MTSFRRLSGLLVSAFALALGLPVPAAIAQPANPIELNWLGGEAPPVSGGVTWGVPWPRGAIPATQNFALTTEAGRNLPLQTWPLAYWPDGSLKWSAFATVANADTTGTLRLATAPAAAEGAGVRVVTTQTSVLVDTGAVRVSMPHRGPALIDSMTIDGREVVSDGRLICVLQTGPDGEAWDSPRRETYYSNVERVTVEQQGPVRAVVKFEGRHKLDGSAREWLPFVVRLYFYAGETSVRVVHSIIYDGEQESDFIRGLGLVFAVPMREQIHNRHVRFSGEDGGLWSEPIQPLAGRSPPPGSPEAYPRQLAGERVQPREAFSPQAQSMMADWAVWSDYKLVQWSAEGFSIRKRTNPQSVWLDAAQGGRSSGLAFVGDVSGGLAVGMKDFWQSHPSGLEIRNAASAEASLTAWLWSPDAPAMDMRHYSTKAHGLSAAYEDVQIGFSTPHGVGRTSELTLFPGGSVPSREVIAAQARAASAPPLLAATPEYLHSVRAFGIWSLPDRNHPVKIRFEEALDSAITHYQREIDQHHWYGFWDFGDVMHGYDPHRHMWRYDVGGFAWDNSELVPDMWLWYSFLRTGRADIFRMAEAMTRHTGEVDSYHLGRFAGLGSRHNVRHWGDGAKEARVSQAALRRYHYYLTADERSGDLMRAVKDADYTLLEFDPLRIARPRDRFPTAATARIRVGPDWLAFAGNWMTEWERTGNTLYRDKILAGMNSLASFEHGLFSGPAVFGYEPDTGRIINDIPGQRHHTSHLVSIMGGAEVMFELLELVDHDAFKQAWLDYCRHYNQATPEGVGGGNFPHWHARLTAYLAMKTNDAELARRAWRELGAVQPMHSVRVEPPAVLKPIDEFTSISTNSTAQNYLNLIELLDMIGDHIPDDLEPRSILPE